VLSTIVWAWAQDAIFGSRSGRAVEDFAKERGWTYTARDKSLETQWALAPFPGRRLSIKGVAKKQRTAAARSAPGKHGQPAGRSPENDAGHRFRERGFQPRLVWRIDADHLVSWVEQDFAAGEMAHRVTTLCQALDFVPRFVFASA
jgi:hypothetical protein